eukprot:1825435-Amphidinium_carterae.1
MASSSSDGPGPNVPTQTHSISEVSPCVPPDAKCRAIASREVLPLCPRSSGRPSSSSHPAVHTIPPHP